MLFKRTWRQSAGHAWLISRNVATGFIVGYTLYKTKKTAAGWLYIHLGIWTLTICLAKHK